MKSETSGVFAGVTASQQASEVWGFVAEGYEAVRDELASVVADEPGLGAQLAVLHGGHRVVDLHAGLPDDALLALYSSSKGAAHLVVALLVQEGVLDLDRSATAYWPDLPAGLTLRGLLAHTRRAWSASAGRLPSVAPSVAPSVVVTA